MIDVVAAILKKEGRILIAKRKEGKKLAGKWEFPGGKVEIGETPESALVREFLEEFGVRIEVGALVGESIFDYPHGSIRLLGYQATWLSGDFSLRDHDEIRWIDIRELQYVDLAPADLPLVDKILNPGKD